MPIRERQASPSLHGITALRSSGVLPVCIGQSLASPRRPPSGALGKLASPNPNFPHFCIAGERTCILGSRSGQAQPSLGQPRGNTAMITGLTAAARTVPFTALMLAACVSESKYEAQTQQLQAAQAQSAAEQAQIAKMQQQNKWVVAGDMLFPEGGYQLSANGKQALNQYVAQLQNLKTAKAAVSGYTANLPAGPALQRWGIANNIDLPSRRADNVVAYFPPQGVTPNIISAKGFGAPPPAASNDMPQGGAKNR